MNRKLERMRGKRQERGGKDQNFLITPDGSLSTKLDLLRCQVYLKYLNFVSTKDFVPKLFANYLQNVTSLSCR